MKHKIRWLAVEIVAVLGLFFWFRGCETADPVPSKPSSLSVKLPKDTDVLIVTKPSKIVVARRNPDATVSVTEVNEYGHGSKTEVKHNGEVVVKPITYGWSNDIGLSIGHDSIGVGHEFFYWRRLTVMGSSNFINFKTGELQLDLALGIGYRLPIRKLNNLSIFTSVNTEGKVVTRLFVRFGNS